MIEDYRTRNRQRFLDGLWMEGIKGGDSRNFATPLASHGLDPKGAVHWNLGWESLHEAAAELGEAKFTAHGVLLATTGDRTGRSPNDRFIIDEPGLSDDVWWGNHNRPTTPEVFEGLLERTVAHLNDSENLFVKDAFCGADPDYRMPVRLVTEKAWHAAFMHNMFVRASKEEILSHVPQYTILHAPDLHASPSSDGVNSEAFVILALDRGLVIIGGTHYAGEIKKAIFTIMNHILPAKGLLPMHCSANTDGESAALFFGLSGTGKTTLSADPGRALVGDDEHGWAPGSVFNIEGGCYAKCIDLSQKNEPVIWNAIKFGTILENVVLDETRTPDYTDTSLTQNSRAAYPLSHIEKRVAENRGGEPRSVVFLTCDVSGVLPPVSVLSEEAAAYHFLSGYTAKVGSTEIGSTSDIESTFSTCFGAPFFPRPAGVYAELLIKRVKAFGAKVYLVNTGWTGGPYGTGSRFDIPTTRAIIDAIVSGSLADVDTQHIDALNLDVPVAVEGVDSNLLVPQNTWADKEKYNEYAANLVNDFKQNFEKYDVSDAIVKAGPGN